MVFFNSLQAYLIMILFFLFLSLVTIENRRPSKSQKNFWWSKMCPRIPTLSPLRGEFALVYFGDRGTGFCRIPPHFLRDRVFTVNHRGWNLIQSSHLVKEEKSRSFSDKFFLWVLQALMHATSALFLLISWSPNHHFNRKSLNLRISPSKRQWFYNSSASHIRFFFIATQSADLFDQWVSNKINSHRFLKIFGNRTL